MGFKMGKQAVEWIISGKSGVFTAFKDGRLIPVELKKQA
jgi:6-phosphofructokinase